MRRELIDYVVLDALANDIESLEDILRILNSSSELGWRDLHPEEFTRAEVVPAIVRAVRDGSIMACHFSEDENALVDAGEGVLPPGSLDDLWFRLTLKGRLLLQAWEPPRSA